MATTGHPDFDAFIDRYALEVAALYHDTFARMRARLPGATILVYDNYNALAAGFSPSDRVGDVIVSLAAYPRWVTLFFLRGIDLDDPTGRLEGSGNQVRSVRLSNVSTLTEPAVEALIADAVARTRLPLDADTPSEIIIKSVSAKQRPRRPVGA